MSIDPRLATPPDKDESDDEPTCDFCGGPAGSETLGGHHLCMEHEEIYWRAVNSKLDAARGK